MKPSFLIIISFFALLFLGCKKNTIYDITYTGNLFLLDTIKFQSNAPAGSTLLWKFSDPGNWPHSTTTSTDASPTHAFATCGQVTVSLIINNDTAHPVTKILHISSGVQKIAGKRYFSGSCGNFTDSIIVIDDKTIYLSNEKYTLRLLTRQYDIAFEYSSGSVYFLNIYFSPQNSTIIYQQALAATGLPISSCTSCSY